MYYIGLDVSTGTIEIAVLYLGEDKTVQVVEDTQWPVPATDAADRYKTIYSQVLGLKKTYKECCFAIVASQTSNSSGLGHLLSAELRGVVTVSAANLGVETRQINASSEAKRQKYSGFKALKADESYWKDKFNDSLTKTRRQAAYVALKLIETHNG